MSLGPRQRVDENKWGEIMAIYKVHSRPTGIQIQLCVCLNHGPVRANTAVDHLWLLGRESSTPCPSGLRDRVNVLCYPTGTRVQDQMSPGSPLCPPGQRYPLGDFGPGG